MKEVIGVIGHVDHVKTILISTAPELKVTTDKKTIQEIIEDNKSIPYTNPQVIPLREWNFKSGRELRRERRKKNRKK